MCSAGDPNPVFGAHPGCVKLIAVTTDPVDRSGAALENTAPLLSAPQRYISVAGTYILAV